MIEALVEEIKQKLNKGEQKENNGCLLDQPFRMKLIEEFKDMRDQMKQGLRIERAKEQLVNLVVSLSVEDILSEAGIEEREDVLKQEELI